MSTVDFVLMVCYVIGFALMSLSLSEYFIWFVRENVKSMGSRENLVLAIMSFFVIFIWIGTLIFVVSNSNLFCISFVVFMTMHFLLPRLFKKVANKQIKIQSK